MMASREHVVAMDCLDIQPLLARIAERRFTVGIVGLGYVGLPLMRAASAKGFAVLGFDVDAGKVAALNDGKSQLKHIPDAHIAKVRAAGLFEATTEPARMHEADAILVCVPTPLTRQREPDLSYVEDTIRALAPHMRPGQLLVLESTTYPGTTCEVIAPILEAAGLVPGEDVLLAYSPEREDPGNPEYSTHSIPKVVGAESEAALELAATLYEQFVARVVRVSSTATAEAVKLTENIFRAVNIALVNELKVVFDRMGIDIWEVIEAAKSKPFGYMPFYPGPGLGGHCIPIDPFYLTWKAREFGVSTRFIELAGEVNTAMPLYVVQRLAEALDQRTGKGLNGAAILILGIAYKKDVDDMRESPALTIIDLLQRRGARIAYNDPYVPAIQPTRKHGPLAGMRSVELTPASLAAFDAALVVTEHSGVDYALVAAHCPLLVDTRNVTRGIARRDSIVRA